MTDNVAESTHTRPSPEPLSRWTSTETRTLAQRTTTASSAPAAACNSFNRDAEGAAAHRSPPQRASPADTDAERGPACPPSMATVFANLRSPPEFAGPRLSATTLVIPSELLWVAVKRLWRNRTGADRQSTPADRHRVSTRIRRMASAAAEKKWPRESQCWALSTSTSRM